jgi:hypothetical protein
MNGDIFPIDVRLCSAPSQKELHRCGIHTALSLGGCFPRSTAALPNFAKDVALYYECWISVATEDVGILEKQQRGLGSVLYRPGWLSWRDDLVQAVHNRVMARLPEITDASRRS